MISPTASRGGAPHRRLDRIQSAPINNPTTAPHALEHRLHENGALEHRLRENDA
jgi:hypothetical protein